MRRDGGTKAETGAGPWLGLFIGAAMTVVAVIAVLSYRPGPPLGPSRIDQTAAPLIAPAAPSTMR